MFKIVENIGFGGCKQLKYHVSNQQTNTRQSTTTTRFLEPIRRITGLSGVYLFYRNSISFPIQHLSSLPPHLPTKKKQTNKNKKTKTAPLIRCTWWLTVLTFESVALSLSQDDILKGDHFRGWIQKIQKGLARTVLPAIQLLFIFLRIL